MRSCENCRRRRRRTRAMRARAPTTRGTRTVGTTRASTTARGGTPRRSRRSYAGSRRRTAVPERPSAATSTRATRPRSPITSWRRTSGHTGPSGTSCGASTRAPPTPTPRPPPWSASRRPRRWCWSSRVPRNSARDAASDGPSTTPPRSCPPCYPRRTGTTTAWWA